MSGAGSSGKNYYGFGKGKGGRKGDPIIWEGPLGPDSFPEPVFEFPPQHKSEFTNETPLRQYDNRRETWPKCRHGEDCLVQMCTDGMDGGRRFFKCPHAWVMLGCFISLFIETSYMKFVLQSSDAPDNCGFTRWVDPAPIDSVQEFI